MPGGQRGEGAVFVPGHHSPCVTAVPTVNSVRVENVEVVGWVLLGPKVNANSLYSFTGGALVEVSEPC